MDFVTEACQDVAFSGITVQHWLTIPYIYL